MCLQLQHWTAVPFLVAPTLVVKIIYYVIDYEWIATSLLFPCSCRSLQQNASELSHLVDSEKRCRAWQTDGKRGEPPLQARIHQETTCRWIHTRNHLAKCRETPLRHEELSLIGQGNTPNHYHRHSHRHSLRSRVPATDTEGHSTEK